MLLYSVPIWTQSTEFPAAFCAEWFMRHCMAGILAVVRSATGTQNANAFAMYLQVTAHAQQPHTNTHTHTPHSINMCRHGNGTCHPQTTSAQSTCRCCNSSSDACTWRATPAAVLPCVLLCPVRECVLCREWTFENNPLFAVEASSTRAKMKSTSFVAHFEQRWKYLKCSSRAFAGATHYIIWYVRGVFSHKFAVCVIVALLTFRHLLRQCDICTFTRMNTDTDAVRTAPAAFCQR